jgi:hypothetical protein
MGTDMKSYMACGGWKVIAIDANGKKWHYRMDTEKDAELLSKALLFHSLAVVDTEIHPDT